MDTLMIAGIINVVAIGAVWIISMRRNANLQNIYREHRELKTQFDQVQECLRESENNLVKVQEQLLTRQERVEELQAALNLKDEREQQNQLQLLELNRNNSRLSSESILLRQKVDELQTKSTEYEAIVGNKTSQLQESGKNNILLSEQLNSRDQKISELQQLTTELQTKITDNEAIINNKTLQLQESGKNNILLSEQLNSRDQKITELQQLIEELKGSEEKLEQRLKSQFELISNKIIEDSRNKVSKFNAENISALMKPFETEIKEFKDQISRANKEQTKERTELETKIKEMVAISQGMSAEAKNLSNALRGNNKAAGNWGETILENILQNSGLTAGREGYELQEMLRDADGNPYRNDTGRKMIPDAIVHFPDNRNVIIDSKVSIAAYTDYCNADNEEDKKIHIKRHLASIKAHIDNLNVKSYESYVDGSLDFVMMFIPNDFAAMVALQEDLNLWQNGYNKKVLIISPTNLITSLKIVSDLWSREKQHQNIENILERGRLLFDKCCSFVDSFKKIGEGLQSAVKIYDGASTQLSGNGGIIRQAELLEKTGIKSKKSLAIRSEESKDGIELPSLNETTV